MSDLKKISKNSSMCYIARVSDLTMSIATISIVARYLDTRFLGNYMLVMTSGLILSSIVTMGTEQIIVREISRIKDKASDFLANGIFINCLLFILCITIFSLCVPFLELERTVIIALYLNFFSEVTKVFMRSIISVFLAFEKMEYDALLTFISRILAFVLTVIVALFKLGFIYFFIAYIVGNITGLLVGLAILSKIILIPKIEIRSKELIYIIKESFPIGICIISQQLYFYIGVFVVRILENEAAVALFQGPNRLVTVSQIIPIALLSALQPLMSRLAVTNTSTPKFEYIYQKSFKFLFIISFPIAALGMVLANKIILLLLGEGLKGAVNSFQILIWAVNFIFIDALLTFTLILINKQRLLIIGNVICILTNMTLSIILVKKYGYIGASWATLISFGVICSVDFYFVTKHLKYTPLTQGIIQPIISSFIAGLILYKFLYLNFACLALGGIIIYLGLLSLLKTFTPEEQKLLKRAIVRT